MNEFELLFQRIVADPRYLRNIEYGKPRQGHAEGTVKAHIAELEKNLMELQTAGLISADRYWKVKVLIHVHDSFKAESKRDVAITHPESHATLASRFLSELTADWDMLQITQYHDLGYAIYRKYKDRGQFDMQRLSSVVSTLVDIDLFLLFSIIDACTESKGREMIIWLVTEVGKLRPDATVTTAAILPGRMTIGDVW